MLGTLARVPLMSQGGSATMQQLMQSQPLKGSALGVRREQSAVGSFINIPGLPTPLEPLSECPRHPQRDGVRRNCPWLARRGQHPLCSLSRPQRGRGRCISSLRPLPSVTPLLIFQHILVGWLPEPHGQRFHPAGPIIPPHPLTAQSVSPVILSYLSPPPPLATTQPH